MLRDNVNDERHACLSTDEYQLVDLRLVDLAGSQHLVDHRHGALHEVARQLVQGVAIEYELYVNGVISPLPVSAGVDEDFVYAATSGPTTFTVKAVDRAGNTSEASNGVTVIC